MIKTNNLSYKIKSREILEDINIQFNDGEIIGITGKSGSGKSISLKIMSGSVKDYTGEIMINGTNIKSSKSKDLQKLISFLSYTKTSDIIDDSVFNFLLQSRKPFKKALSPYTDFDIQIVEEYIKIFQLDDFRDRTVLTLSDGILKNVFLAFPFIKKSDILLLDNPTSDLDLYSVSLLQKAIMRYVINGDKIIIISGNDLNFLLQISDRIIIMDNGRIDAEVKPENIDAQIINKYFNSDVLVSRNIYNGRPVIHQYLKG